MMFMSNDPVRDAEDYYNYCEKIMQCKEEEESERIMEEDTEE